MHGICFEAWFENGLLKVVEKGKTPIIARTSFHRKTKLEEICKSMKRFYCTIHRIFPSLIS